MFVLKLVTYQMQGERYVGATGDAAEGGGGARTGAAVALVNTLLSPSSNTVAIIECQGHFARNLKA
jgi:hypothetical protein